MGKQILLNWTRLLTLVMTLGLSGMISQESWGQSGTAVVTTDKNDYPPGATVLISGYGFWPNEEVTLQVTHFDDWGDNSADVHQPWVINSDSQGNISSSWYIPTDQDEFGATLLLTAVGSQSGLSAEWLFTDAGNFTYSTTSGKSNSLTTTSGGTDNSTLSVNVTAPKNNGSFTASLGFSANSGTTIGIGAGANQISITSVTNSFVTGGAQGNDDTEIFSISVSVGASVPNGTYSFRALATSSSGNPNNGSGWDFTIIVGSGSTGGSIGSVTIGAQNGVSTYGTGSNPIFDVTSARGSNGNVNGTYSVSGLPSGVTGSFSLVNFNSTGSNPFPGTTLTLTVPSNLNAGSYNFSVNLSDGTNQASTIGVLTVNKATTVTTVTINGEPFTYTGSAITPATVTVTGAGGLNLTPVANYANNINAGMATASYSYAGDNNYLPSSDSKDFTINKAPTVTTVTINGGPFTYTGSAITPATVTVTGAGGLSLTPAASYADNINAGTATASYSYAESANHLASSDSKTFEIGKANATIEVLGKTVTYDGTAHGATGTATGVGGVDLSAGLNLGATFTDVPGGTANWSFEGGTNYEDESGSVAIVINKKTASVTPNPTSKYCGQVDPLPFSGTLSGFIASDGIIASYTRVAGEGIGNYTISATLSPVAKLANYNITYNTAQFTINGITIDASATSTPIAVGNPAILKATVSSAAAGIPVVFTLDNGNGGITTYNAITDVNGLATATVSGLLVEVYLVTATAGSGCASSIAYLPIYDPNGGFVTGGGWIMSPVGAYSADESLSGKANFGFIAKYKKGSTSVDGNTEFQFHAGNLNFKSRAHEAMSLVIAGSQAMYKGSGTVNGTGDYKFMVSAVDGNITGGGGTDKFRIKIWDANGVIYDNQKGATDNATATTVLGGGSIVIHQPAKGTKRVSTELITVAWNTPVETIKQKVDQMSASWFESRKLAMTLDASDYDPLTPGFYELKADVAENEFFALDEPISIQVLVQDKPKALDITLENSNLSGNLRAGEVLGYLRTIDPVDNIHTYQIGENSDLILEGDKLIWKGSTVPAQLRVTVFSTDRAGQTISKEITLSRELKPGEFLLYPNPAQSETNVMVDLDREAAVAIRIYDAVGRLVVENEAIREGSFTQTFNLDGLAPGFYTVQVKMGDMVMTKRLIKR